MEEQNKTNAFVEVDNVKPVIASIPDNSGFESKYSDPKSGGKILRHKLVDHNLDDYKEVWEIAVDKAKAGCEVHILPVLHPKDNLYPIIFEGALPNKCPDVRINGIYHEIATPVDILHLNKINRSIRMSQKQANHVIIKLLNDFPIIALEGIVKARFITHEDLKTIEFKLRSGKYLEFRRSEYR